MGACQSTNDCDSSIGRYYKSLEESIQLGKLHISAFTEQLYKLSYASNELDELQFTKFTQSLGLSMNDVNSKLFLLTMAKEGKIYSEAKLLQIGILFCTGQCSEKSKLLSKCLTLLCKGDQSTQELELLIEQLIEIVVNLPSKCVNKKYHTQAKAM